MTFLEEIKTELENIREKDNDCNMSELRGIILFGAAACEGGALFGTDSYSLAKRVSVLIKRSLGAAPSEKLDENAEGYKFFLSGDVLKSISLSADNTAIHEEKDLEDEPERKRAFARGAFLASGSAANPEKAYRTEIFSEDESIIEKVFEIFKYFSVDAKKTERKSLFVVYANKSESVGDMLRGLGSGSALFRVFDEMVFKDKRNDINRITNCDVANASRAADSAIKQMNAIEKIERTIGLDSLKPKLCEAAHLREENDIASTGELAQMIGISKSAMHSRLNKIVEIAEEIDE
jgi:hypothetical protein